ncbi:MAG: Citrate synthase [Deltaproteobacteria bacterium ADurb.BinA179]|jgi:citrate synthase|nr:citrate synthase [Pseudomonadota bacterium]OPZ26345.1 MAG: Citrate synthase [Deltaproteobacteria bacterium ADurb.BinA179]HNU73289.1 citrate synthase [Deltaproteobacteria bacterium]HOD71585.1 citrate synthase [Deltaproteobacteria bacterium]HOE73171.1 citrate synthase [Deltaproteobacteria bacterium]
MEEILLKIDELAKYHDQVSPELIKAKDIKLGLRNADGSGVVVGITSKGMVVGYEKNPAPHSGGHVVTPVEGRLLYCGYDVRDLVSGIYQEGRFGFDEVTYLLLTGELPTANDLERFSSTLARRRALTKLERSILMQEGENENQMYALHSVVSHLSRCDSNPESTDLRDETNRCINLIAKFPTIVAYNYNVMRYRNGSNLSIIKPDPYLSTAENFLYMLRGKKPSRFEAELFDLCLILHAEHGGGNNSTFTVRAVSSSGANTYMAICSGIASLSGYLHGGANESVMKMMKSIKKEVRDWQDRDEVKACLARILDGKGHDRSGKIYGMGHAVYTISDPRAVLLKEKAQEFARMRNLSHEYALYCLVEETAKELFRERRGADICVNVDFYSGFIYKLMGIPMELYTPIFAMSRVVGWSAHRIEQLIQNRIMRPAYVSSLAAESSYVPLAERDKAAA